MNWSDYEAVWKRQPLPKGANADLAELRATFEAKRRKLAATLQVRDWSEVAAAFFLVYVYVRLWRRIGVEGWPMGFAILFILGPAAFFVRERLRARRRRLGVDAPLLAKVEADLAELDRQRRLLRTVWFWYLAPCGAAGLIHFGVMLSYAAHRVSAKPHHLSSYFFILLIALLFGALVFLLVARLNRRAVEKNIEPRIAELEKLRQDLLNPAPPAAP